MHDEPQFLVTGVSPSSPVPTAFVLSGVSPLYSSTQSKFSNENRVNLSAMRLPAGAVMSHLFEQLLA